VWSYGRARVTVWRGEERVSREKCVCVCVR
jgi:hypothetical protein